MVGVQIRPTDSSSPIEFSEQEGDGIARRVYHLLQHHDVTTSQDLRDTRKASPTHCQLLQGGVCPWGTGTGVANSVMVYWLWLSESSGTRKDLGED